jgi:uncharacterized protein YggE
MQSAAVSAAQKVGITANGPVVELSEFESVETPPDIVTISAGVINEAPSATAAMRQNAETITKVIARIKALGISERDIQTSGISLDAQYDYRETGAAFRAYQASNRVSVTLRKVEDSGKVLDALVEAGATDLFGPAFGVANPAAANDQARKAAVARLEAQAKAYAGMLGYKGVKVLAVTETLEGGVPLPLTTKVAEAAASSPSTPIQPGLVSTGVSVTITYELVDPTGNGVK